MDGAVSYLTTVKKTFHDEPEKFDEFIKIMLAYKDQRVDTPTVIARMEELMKDHLNLLLGFNAFLPAEFQITIPPEASNVGGRSVPPKPTMDDAISYLTAVKEAFRDEPAKYIELIKLLNDFRARRVDAASVIARVEELMKDHQNLLIGFSVFLPAEAQRILHLKIEQRAASDDNKRKRARFQGDDRHVYESILEILKMYQEGNKCIIELYQEVVALAQGHEDLFMEFSDILS